jgi:hypothetical protein
MKNNNQHQQDTRRFDGWRSRASRVAAPGCARDCRLASNLHFSFSGRRLTAKKDSA